MARTGYPYPTPSEMEVLQVIWRKGASTAGDILEFLRLQGDTEATYASVLKLLKVMHKKDLVTRWRDGKRHVYQAKVRKRETLHQVFESIFQKSITGMHREIVFQLFEGERLSKEALDEIRKICEKAKSSERGDHDAD
jgi:BlaI family penicillinase repressor